MKAHDALAAAPMASYRAGQPALEVGHVWSARRWGSLSVFSNQWSA